MLEIIVDGIVGAGKTTLVNILEKERDFDAFYEISDNLADRILEKFYSDGKRWSLTLQIYFLNKRFYQTKKAEKDGKFIMDRSIYGDYIFAKAQHTLGMMDGLEWEIYEGVHRNLVEHIVPPRLMIYLKCSVDTAIKRLKKRGREYERNVDIQYWKLLHELYENFFMNYNHSKLLIINADEVDFVEREEDKQKVLEIIDETLKMEDGIYEFNGSILRRMENVR